LACIINNPEVGLIILARQNSQIIGMVNLLFTVSTALGERVALLEDMVVSPNIPGSGVGSQLLEQAIQFARLNNCKRITLLTDHTNEVAQHFYQKHGFGFSTMIPLRLSLSN
jgi:GNAT superfamily N-acetyltransferase